jgi:hypothetical protein
VTEVIDAEETFRSYHRELRARLREALDAMDREDERATVSLARLSSIAGDFARYVEACEGWLYPAVAPLVRSNDQVMGPMMVDVRVVDGYGEDAEEMAMESLTSTEDGAAARRRQIERLAARFDAVIGLHLDKLEHLYLPLLEDVPAEERETVVAGVARDYEAAPRWPEASAEPSGRSPSRSAEDPAS